MPPDSRLFKQVQRQVYLILKSNYLSEFYKQVLQNPTWIYKQNTPSLQFNSLGEDPDTAILYR